MSENRQINGSKRSLKMLLASWQTAVSGTTLPQPPPYAGPDVWLTRLTEKTAAVSPGTCFVARVRSTSDGHPYIQQAVAAGASMILAQRSAAELGLTLPPELVYLQVADTAETLAWLAAAWEGFPSRSLVMIGVTGTDGKTSTTALIYEILRAAGLQAGMLSTLKAVIGKTEEPLELHVTTPEAPVVQRHLRRMVDAGLTHCVLESTSIGLAQHRVAAVDFDVAVVTNITHEHLDYHGSYEKYFAAKARLFSSLNQSPFAVAAGHKPAVAKTAVLNRDDSSYEGLARLPVGQQISYGIHNPADIRASQIQYDAHATQFVVQGLSQTPGISITSRLVGEFNVYNMLAAAAVAKALGLSQTAVSQGLQAIANVNGRMQRIDRGQPFLTIVDFAHTPKALEKAIAAAKRMASGRVIVVFGSAGKRDVAKRRMMAEVSAQMADISVLTAEDPRTESLDDILEMMAQGCRRFGGSEGQTFWRVRDRGRAIHFALSLAQPDDLVLICGKGHEQSMCFGTTEYPWDDRDATVAALDTFLAQQPMSDLGLPTFAEPESFIT